MIFLLPSILLLVAVFIMYRNSVRRLVGLFFSLVVLVFLLITGAYFFSDYFTGAGINEAVIYHLTVGLEGAGFGEYKGLILGGIAYLIFSIGMTVLIFKASVSGVSKKKGPHLLTTILTMGLLLGSLVFHPAITDLLEVFNLPYNAQVVPVSDNTAVKSREIVSDHFNDNYHLPVIRSRSKNPPNLVMIYLEGLERTYFDESRFPGLIKSLREVEDHSISFTDIRQLWGTGWTVGGITASQCGIPLVASAGGNGMGGMELFLPGAVAVGDLLQDEGYYLVYMGGASRRFAGKGNFFSTHGFAEVLGRDELLPEVLDPRYVNSWGLYDDTLLDLAYQRFVKLSKSGKKFGLVMLTLDTHHPDGHLSKSCVRSSYGDGSNNILNAVAGSEWLIAEFVNKIINSEYSANTVICLVSDHIALKNTAWKTLQQGERKNLFMVIPPGKSKAVKVSRPGSTLDTGLTLLNLMGFKVDELGLGRNLLNKEKSTFVEKFTNPNSVLKKWRKEFFSFWKFPDVCKSFAVFPSQGKAVIDGRTVKLPFLIEVDETLKTKNIKFYMEGPNLLSYISNYNSNQRFVWLDAGSIVKNLASGFSKYPDKCCIFAGSLGCVKPLKIACTSNYEIPIDDLRQALSAPSSESVYDERYSSLEAFRCGVETLFYMNVNVAPWVELDNLLLTSSCASGGKSGVFSGSTKHVLTEITRGVSLVGLAGAKKVQVLASFDPCVKNWKVKQQEPFAAIIKRFSNQYLAFAVMVHLTPFCSDVDLSPILKDIGLERWGELKFRQPYIALISAQHKTMEMLVPAKSALGIMIKAQK